MHFRRHCEPFDFAQDKPCGEFIESIREAISALE